jgi:hypothetical protein
MNYSEYKSDKFYEYDRKVDALIEEKIKIIDMATKAFQKYSQNNANH